MLNSFQHLSFSQDTIQATVIEFQKMMFFSTTTRVKKIKFIRIYTSTIEARESLDPRLREDDVWFPLSL